MPPLAVLLSFSIKSPTAPKHLAEAESWKQELQKSTEACDVGPHRTDVGRVHMIQQRLDLLLCRHQHEQPALHSISDSAEPCHQHGALCMD